MKKRPAKKGGASLFRRLLRLALGLVLLLVVFVAGVNYYVTTANRDRLYTDLTKVPPAEVALVLGTSPRLRNGGQNQHFSGRMDAAAALYRAGKVRHLLVSGDNRKLNYNEPVMMRKALIARGVPAGAITCDFAGFRTLDSVVRAREIFGLQRCLIVTQRYHNPRALEIARATGLDADGFSPPDVDFANSFTTECREVLARVAAVLDLYLLDRDPHFLGKPEPIKLADRR
jgi:SanA protein